MKSIQHFGVKSILMALTLLGASVMSAPVYALAFESSDEALPFKRGDLQAVKHIVEEGHFLKKSSNLTIIEALYFSIDSGNLGLVKYLASKGWISVCKSESYCCPIHEAAYHELQTGEPMIRFFLSHGFSPHDLDTGGNTPLHYAVTNGRSKMVKYLCEIGVDANIKDKYHQETPLEVARRYSTSARQSLDSKEDAKIRAGLKEVINYLQSGQCKKK